MTHLVCLYFCRASRGKHLTVYVRIPSGQGRNEDVELWSHSNDTLASLKHQLQQKYVYVIRYIDLSVIIGMRKSTTQGIVLEFLGILTYKRTYSW